MPRKSIFMSAVSQECGDPSATPNRADFCQ